MPNTLDITPSPRVLRMLGQIDFAPWQCLAELIDNSIDSFIEQQRAGHPASDAWIRVHAPSLSELDFGTGVLSIEDNASGMTLGQLQNAVKAGYSGNDPVDKMGLFGMGFNISTARLGRRTEVWTTTADSPDWIRVTIDFDELERRQTFHVPVESIPKQGDELDRPTHGTRVKISRLEPDRIRALIWGAGKAKTRRRLGKIYGRVMANVGITISYDGERVQPWRHCTWNRSRSVPTAEFGNVPAIIDINQTLSPRRFCKTCWVWLTDSDSVCSSCGNSENVIERGRSVHGWIGVQRYFDKEHYGIDLIRNGRVIEELDKSFFTFRDSNGDDLFEYPRDAVHWGGRIVGELEIDFVRVSHQKDSFDKLDPEWKHVVESVRGTSPLQPKISERMNLSRNTSPLARLFSGYRKGTAGLKDLVPADARGAGLNSGPIKDYVEKFYLGEQEYQDDTKWYELVLQAERKRRGDSSGADEAAGEIPIGDPKTTQQQNSSSAPEPLPVTNPPPITEIADPELSRTYELEMLPGSPAISVSAYKHSNAPTGPAFSIKPDGFRVRFDYFPKASFFEESLETPADCLIVDLAQHFLVLSAATPRETPVSLIAHEIRKKYFPQMLTDVSDAADAAESILNGLRQLYDENLPSHAPIDTSMLDARLIQQVRTRAFQADAMNEEQVEEALSKGQFARYLNNALLIELIQNWPEIATDGKYFTLPYLSLATELRSGALETLTQALGDLRWLAEEGFGAVSKDTAWRLRYARALASLRLMESWIA